MGTKITFNTSRAYTYDSLQTKYNSFMTPSFEVLINGQNVQQGSSYISSLEVNIPVSAATEMKTNEVSECSFTIAGIFDLKTSKFDDKIMKKMNIGAKVEVSGGYGKTVVLFIGILQHVHVSYGQGGAVINATALDSSTLLRNGKKFTIFENEDRNSMIKKLLQGCTVNGFAEMNQTNIGQFSGEKIRLEQAGLDDCEFITTLARREKYIFAIIHGQVILKDLYQQTKPIIELKYGQNLVSFDMELDTSKQIGKVTIGAIHDKNRNALQATVNKTSISSSGKTALKLMPELKNVSIESKDPLENEATGLKKIAQAIFDERAMSFVSGRGSCIGLPELVPGRYIKLSGLGKQVNGKYFISRVIHRFDESGFTTQFEVKGVETNWEL